MTSNIVVDDMGELASILIDGSDHFGVSTVLFDSHEELIWVGNEGGHIASYFGSEMQKYTSFQAHENEVRYLLTNDEGVLSLTHNEIRFTKRHGIKLFSLSGSNMTDMQCMLQKDDSTVLIAGHQNEIFELDLHRHKIVKEYLVEPGTCIMKVSSRYLCCGDTSGKIRLRDPKSLNCEHVFFAHSGTLSDFDVLGNTLITCGFSSRHGHLAVDRFLMMYDIRMLRSLPPIQTPMLEPFMLKFSSTMSSRVQVVSQSGQFQFLDIDGSMTARSMYIYHVNTQGGLLTGFDISPNGQASIFGDSSGVVHLWVDCGMEHLAFNIYSRPTSFADEIPHSHPFDIDDYTIPYSSFPLPHCSEPLLSDWPKNLLKRRDRRTPPIDPEILRTMVVKGFIGQAPNPGNRLRNQVPYKWRASSKSKREVPESPMNREQNPFSTLVPKIYRRVEMRYSKLGIDDFNFQHYNKTSFAGLEIHIPNAYCNAMLQIFYFLEPLKVFLQNHVCKKEFCLACELGFLFDMLDQSSGEVCQASNFLRAFRTLREASALGLLLPDTDEYQGKVNYSHLIQSWQRFVLQQLLREELEESKEKGETEKISVIESLFGCQVQRTSQCSQCGRQTARDDVTLSTALLYPDNRDNRDVSFVNVLKSSLLGIQSSPAWCESCEKYQLTIHSKKLRRLPDVLMINCQVDMEKHKKFWNCSQTDVQSQKSVSQKGALGQSNRSTIPCRFGESCSRTDCGFWHPKYGELAPSEPESTILTSKEDCVLTWVPFCLMLKLAEDGTLSCYEAELDDGDIEDGCTVYDLKSTVAHVKDYNSPGNLVAMIDVEKSYHKTDSQEEKGGWYLFNDFAVSNICKDEAVEFDLSWKMPCVLQFVRRNMKTDYDLTGSRTIDDRVILGDRSLSLLHDIHGQKNFTPLSLDEAKKEGFLVGIDCEFVTLNQEESEIRSDGTRSTVKPSHMSVARVTCVRGDGPLIGVPFIDDYISTSEQVVDYLTEFSGINPGDLDATRSSKHLTTLKSTYVKLKYLLEQKVLFVGHGLQKDFRVLNIKVPKVQIVDTVQLFHLPQQRFISLRFLAWYFLGITIQSSSHDSTEDACTALRLYQRFKELMQKGDTEFHGTLNRLYETGRSLSWQVED